MRMPAPLLLLLLSACTVGPDYRPPALETPDLYRRADAAPTTAGDGAQAWWRGFDTPSLDRLVARVRGANLDLAAASERLAEARALAMEAAADGGPALDGRGTAVGRRLMHSTDDSDPDATSADATGALLFSWTPDLFGGQRRATQAARAEVTRRAFLRADLDRTLTAQAVRLSLAVSRDRERLALLERSLELQGQTLDLVRERNAAGLAAGLDVSRAEAQVGATQARRGPLKRAIARNRAGLAVLAALPRLPPDLDPPDAIADPSSVFPPMGPPADLLRQRPDVRAAEAELARATAEIGIFEAELYPSLSLPGTLSAGASGLGTGGVVRSVLATLTARLDIPLFDGGARRARLSAAEARAREALLSYRRVLIEAFTQVEAALGELAAARQRRADLERTVVASGAAARQAEQLYTQGLAGFLDVLDAERTLLDNRQNLAEARADEGLLIADLYAALGVMPDPPDTAATGKPPHP